MLATGMDSTKCQFDVTDPDQEARFFRNEFNKIGYDQRNLISVREKDASRG